MREMVAFRLSFYSFFGIKEGKVDLSIMLKYFVVGRGDRVEDIRVEWLGGYE